MRLHEVDDPDAQMLSRFASSIQLERQDFNGRMLTLRRSDLRVLAACMGRSLEDLGVRLEQLGLRAAVRVATSATLAGVGSVAVAAGTLRSDLGSAAHDQPTPEHLGQDPGPG